MKKRMSAEQRRASIIQAARRAYARHGFYGTTTRDLAKEAGVSEALLFKHFATKDNIYQAMVDGWFEHPPAEGFPFDSDAVNPSRRIVVRTYRMASKILGAVLRGDEEEVTKQRLMFQSLLSDGRFARLVHARLPLEGRNEMAALMTRAIAAGDCRPLRSPVDYVFIFTVNLQSALLLFFAHEPPFHQLKFSGDELVDYFVWYALRGMGFNDDVIERNLDAAKAELVAKNMEDLNDE